MVVMKTSEYRNNFVPKFSDNFNSYASNVGYRSSRRNAEFEHNKDVFTWEPEQWRKDSYSHVLQEQVRPGVEPSIQYKHAVLVQGQEETTETASNETNNNNVAVQCPPSVQVRIFEHCRMVRTDLYD